MSSEREAKCHKLYEEYKIFISYVKHKIESYMCTHSYSENKKSYSISKFGSLDSSGGRYPDNLLLSRRLQVQRNILLTNIQA
jgi:hypothetical protein